jgi:hypothetical protein
MQSSHYKQLSGATDDLAEKPAGYLVVSKQIKEQGTRLFYVYLGETFINIVKNTPVHARYFHEHIIPIRPVKLFFDIEDKSGVTSVDEFMHIVENFVNATDRFISNFLKKTVRSCAISCANRQNHHSVHLTFDISFPNVTHMMCFKDKLNSENIYMPFIDEQMYSVSGVKSLRTMYSNKMIKQFSALRQFCCMPLGQHEDDFSFDEDLFSRSLITYMDKDCPMVSFDPSELTCKMTLKYGVRIVVKPPEELYSNIESWLSDKIKCTHKLVSSDEHEFCILVHPSFYCPIIGNNHTSNGSHLFFKHYGDFVDMTIYCLGCNCTSKYKQNIMAIL